MKPRGLLAILLCPLLLAVGCTSSAPSVEESGAPRAESTDQFTRTTEGSPTQTQQIASTTQAPPSSSAQVRLDPTIIVLDASGSMKVDDAPGQRIDAAKKAVLSLVDGLPDSAPVGLMVYGTGTDSSDDAKPRGCKDIKTLVPVAPLDRAGFLAEVGAVSASGYTPIGAALREAVAQLPGDGPRNIVLVSDGEDTCGPPDPCEVADELHGANTGLAIHAVGFRVSGPAKDQLSCIARVGGGGYVDAANSAQLRARLRIVTDPNAAVNTLTAQGFSELQIGMTIAAAELVDPSISAPAIGTVTIVWRDCDVTITDGAVVAIRPHGSIPTQDGLAVGDDMGKAGQLYGTTVAATENGRVHAIFAATEGSDIGYDVTFSPSSSAAAGQLSGTITAIGLCRCKPKQTTFAAADAAAFLKTPGRWWFHTPDDGWYCSVSSRVFCESAAYNGNDSANFPLPTGVDDKLPVDGELPLVGGIVTIDRGVATYGSEGHGEVSEFYYDKDKGAPGPGQILTDGQVLTVGGYRCFVIGFAVTCAETASGIGFTADQTEYRLHPRDGAIPESGQSATQPAARGPACPSGFQIRALVSTAGGGAAICENPSATSERSRYEVLASDDAYHSGAAQTTFSSQLGRQDDGALCGVSEGYVICVSRTKVTFTMFDTVEFQQAVTAINAGDGYLP